MNERSQTPIRSWIRAAAGVALALASMFSVASLPALADDSDAGSGVARISVLHGNVTVQRGDSGDTVAAIANAPVSVGDYVSTSGDDSRAEVQLDANDFVRMGTGAQLRFTQLDPSQQTVQLAAGTVEVRIFKEEADPEVQTPAIAIRPSVAGQYRVSVASDGSTTFTVRSGSADLLAPQGTQTIGAGLTIIISGSSSAPVIRPVAAVAYDGFDSWNAQRDQYISQAASSPYVNADMVGATDLNAYGHWVYVAGYGNSWVPYSITPGWAPYHYGRWAWQPYYGWTWVGYEPWGWAPYHYGRWFYAASYGWAWYPGPVYVHPVYRPAVVAFFGFGGGGSSFSVAFGNVGWVPLAPREPFHPWWGPTVVNRTVVNVTNINVTNVNITNVYRNASVAGGVAVVSHANFTNGGAYHYVPIQAEELHSVALVKSAVPVVPTRQNLAYTKVDASHPVAATPLSPHFQRLAAPEKLPPSFTTQRLAIQTATQHAYHGDGSPVGGSSPWDRFDSGNGAGHQNEPGATHGQTQGTANDPWSKFAPENNSYTAKTNGASHHATGANAHHGNSKPRPAPKTKQSSSPKTKNH